MTSDSTPQLPQKGENAWARAVMWISIVFLMLAAALYIFKSLRDLPGEVTKKTGDAIQKVGSAVADVVSAFNQKTLTSSFVSYATSLNANHYLQFATLRQVEAFTQSDQATTAFGYVPLPEVIVEAKAPVEYTYYLDLNAKWEFIVKDNTVYVRAPHVRFNKPAVDASEITYEVKKGSLLRNQNEAIENLKKSITFMTQLKAKENIGLVRETGRKQTAEFVEKWLMNSFSDGRKYQVKVFFSGEVLPTEAQMQGRPLQ